MFESLVVLVVAAHLLAVNLAAAGPIVAPLVEWHGSRRGQIALQEAALNLAKWSILAAAVGIGLGLLALATVTIWHPQGNLQYLGALKQVPIGRWWFTGAEIVFYFACMAAYVLLWRRLERFRLAHRAVALSAGTNLLYHFPALFTILSVLVEKPSLHGQTLDRQLYLKLLLDHEVLARVLHVWSASFAVTGLALAWIAGRIAGQNGCNSGNGPVKCTLRTLHAPREESSRRSVRSTLQNAELAHYCNSSPTALGGRISLAATLLQVPVGVWVLLTLPESQQQRAMGGDLLCTAMFGASVVLALALMHQLAMLALGDTTSKRIRLAMILMASVVLLMTATLHLARG